MPTEGMPAPAFRAPDQDGVERKMKDYHGSWLMLYFYPKDDSAGCVAEACGIRDSFAELRRMGTRVVGVSTDPVKSHRRFADRYAIPFTLLSDEDKTIVNAYGAWQLKTMLGKSYMGTVRSSYLIDPEGIIRKAYPIVNPEEHAAEIVRDLKVLMAA